MSAPASVRVAGWIAAVEGATGLVVAAVLLARGLGGADQRAVNGFGTAIFFLVAGGGVLAAGAALAAGKRWGRGLVVFTQLLLLPVVWYLVGRLAPTGVRCSRRDCGGDGLGLLFSPSSVRWAASGQRSPASSASSGPDTR